MEATAFAPFAAMRDGCALVAGGTGGLGRAICRRFAQAGSPVVVGWRGDAAAGEALARELDRDGPGGLAARIDLSDPEGVEAAMQAAEARFGRVHTVVCAAGPKVKVGAIADLSPADWRAALDADAGGFFTLAVAAIPRLRRSRGSIVALSTAGTRRYPPLDVMSAGPKASVEMLVTGIAREEGRNGVRANAVGVGQIDAGQGAQMHDDPRFQRLAARVLKATPLRRFGTAEEVADAVLFLASPMASFVSGEMICVDGGGHA